jgi:ubiquinone biosynthesis protein
MKITAIPQLYRNIQRWREIFAVLQRYGLADWFSRYDMIPIRDWFKDRRGVPLSQYSREARVRMALTELGPTFVKLGQVLAGRPDLVGLKLGEELKGLRANVPADPIQTVIETLRKELGDRYETELCDLDPVPLAAASIGQVHHARLRDGTEVVVKVQRADIEETMRRDMEVLSGLAVLAERAGAFSSFGPSEMVRQLSPMLKRELDFDRERQNLEHFRALLAKREHEVVIPASVESLCTRRVLVMNELRGRSLAEFLKKPPIIPLAAQEPKATETNSPARDLARVEADASVDRERIAQIIASVYLTMLFDEGLFHADPHPGNLLILEDGRLGILDFGMVGRIDESLRETIEEMLVSIATGDQNRLLRLIRRAGDAPPTLDESALAIDVADYVATYGRQRLGHFDLTGALNALSELLHRHSIKLPAQSALLLKMLISLEGTLKELGARFDSLDVVRGFVRQSMTRRLSPQRRLRQARRIYLEAENFLEQAPDELLGLMRSARQGDVTLQLEHRRIGPTVNRLVLGIMASAVFLGSSLLLAFEVPPVLFAEATTWGLERLSVLGLLGIAASLAVMLRLILAINRSGHLTRGNDD